MVLLKKNAYKEKLNYKGIIFKSMQTGLFMISPASEASQLNTTCGHYSIPAGGPQGSPNLFNFYINAIPFNLSSHLELFADTYS